MHDNLIKWLEAAVGPSRELDCQLAFTSGLFARREAEGKGVCYVRMKDDEIEVWPGCGGAQLVPRFTASIDAALTLVPEGVFWRVGHDGEGQDPSLFKAQVLGGRLGVGISSHAALATCIAALRAIEEGEG